VLDLSYEMEHPLTLFRSYEVACGNVSEENYVSKDMVWTRATFLPINNAFLYFRDENDSVHTYALSTLDRKVYYDNASMPERITVKFSSDTFVLNENIYYTNDSYPMTVTWELNALAGDLNYANLYLGYHFDGKLSFTKAYVPGMLDWESPWNNPSKVQGWATTDFSGKNLTDKYLDAIDEQNHVGFGLKFTDMPDTGNVGALENGNIDAIRFQYQFYKVSAHSSYSVSYQVLTFAEGGYGINNTALKDLTKMNALFEQKVSPEFDVKSRNFASIVQEQYIQFVVYDKQVFDYTLLNSGWLQLVYGNDRYVVCKISTNHR
jgi:hypothetical protein